MSRPALEEHRHGRIVLGTLLAMICFSLVVWNLPKSHFRATMSPQVSPLVSALGLWQGWAMFSPDPASHANELAAEVRYADGSVRRWSPPRPGPLTGVARDERWRNWSGKVRMDQNRALWAPAAAWVAERAATDSSEIVEVSLIRRWTATRQPGTWDVVDRVWEEFEFYSWDPVTGEGTDHGEAGDDDRVRSPLARAAEPVDRDDPEEIDE